MLSSVFAVGQLGNIFDQVPGTNSEDKGPDLKIEAVIRPSAVRDGQQVVIPVPDRVDYPGGSVARYRAPGDPPGGVRVHLSESYQEGSTLRLRGQGGEHPTTGRPGDLWITITMASSSVPVGRVLLLMLAVVFALTLVAWWGRGA